MSKEKKISEMENKKEQFVALTVTWSSARMIAAGG